MHKTGWDRDDHMSVAAALIGDVVGSREHSDRAGVQRDVRRALASVNTAVAAVQPLDVTVGDEFQGVFPTAADALLAALLVRLELLPAVDTRYGIGWGPYTVFDRDRAIVSQDGPAWWAARDAVDHVKLRSAHARARHLRTWFAERPRQEEPGAEPSAATGSLNAFLLCRDESIGRMNDRSVRLLRGLLSGKTQAEMAEAEEITQSAVSQLLSRSGGYAIRDAHHVLAGRTP
jgi:hypothetical protein